MVRKFLLKGGKFAQLYTSAALMKLGLFRGGTRAEIPQISTAMTNFSPQWLCNFLQGVVGADTASLSSLSSKAWMTLRGPEP